MRDEPNASNRPPRANEGGRRRINDPTAATVPDRSAGCTAAAPLCDGAPTAELASFGIEMPTRSIEDVALADGACRNLTAPTDRTCNSGAADRECLLVQLKSRRVAKDHDVRSSQMRSS